MSNVAIVVDRAFGHRLSELTRSRAVWVVESTTNGPFIRDVRREMQSVDRRDQMTALTSFTDNDDWSPEELCAGVVGDVEEHHGALSTDPPWSAIEVFGAALTPALQAAFEDIGASKFESTADGFRCRR